MAALAYLIMYMPKAISTLLVGISIKICLHHPELDPDAFNSKYLRLLLGWSVMLVFLFQMLMHPLHTGFK